MTTTFKGRPVEFSVEGYGEGAMVTDAGYLDGDKEALTDDEHYELEQENADLVAEEAFQNAVCAAEYACEGDR